MAAVLSSKRVSVTDNSGLSEAVRSAEHLFETSTIAEIREVDTKTISDIEEKKKQLRQLVGDSYRDLISSADTILAMAACCDSVVGTLQQTKTGFGTLAESLRDKHASEQARKSSMQRKALYALASRIKYIVDTSEMIWGSLDAGDVLGASLRFLRAATVHKLLLQAAGPSVTSRFPLVSHQWSAIEKLRSQIIDRIGQKLRTAGPLRTQDAASALAAAAFLQGLGPSEVLDMFFDARRACLAAHLASLTKDGTSATVADVTQALCTCVAYLQDAMWQAAELLLDGGMGEAKTQLPARVSAESGGDAELMFGPALEGASSTEADAWLAQSAVVEQRVTSLTQSQLASACGDWLSSLGADYKAAGPGILHACGSAAQLVQVEEAVRAGIAAWKAPATPASAGGEASSPTKGKLHSWQAACDWALGRHVNVWDEVLEAAFLQHSKELISTSCKAVSAGYERPLQACLHDAATAQQAPAGAFQTASWPEALPAFISAMPSSPRHMLEAVLSQSLSLDAAARQSLAQQAAAAAADQHSQDRQWRLQVAHLQELVDEGLWQCLRNALLLCGDTEQHKGKLNSTDSFGGSRRQAGRRAPALETFIQEQCAQAAGDIAGILASKLESLPPADGAVMGSAAIEQALVIARAARALASPDSCLRMVLGAPADWREAIVVAAPEGPDSSIGAWRGHKQPGSLHRPALRSAPLPAFQQLQAKFKSVAEDAHEKWAQWAAQSLAQQLAQQLSADAALTSPVALRSWQETIIKAEDESSGGEEVRFWLPGMPSPQVLAVLLAALAELHRAGGATLGTGAVQLLAWHLSGACLNSLRLLAAAIDSFTEKGLLQLLMDVRFLHDTLAGGRPRQPAPAQPAHSASPSSSGREQEGEYRQLEAQLQERLDPIDWAMYEPYLWANTVALRQRLGVLFGALLSLHYPPSEVMAKAAAGAEANVMQMAPTAQRFPYLPIATPSATASRALPAHLSTALPSLATGRQRLL
ncbi:hypothetical protein WJX73_005829 [Symbiochloris irregularis]|uniref:Conserved oligomeric Golgi complex subunit 1 n=1 Tax=Symbiochloris irregularis TaxID=706552 RepID=A0AAW1NZJ3_9CHLO